MSLKNDIEMLKVEIKELQQLTIQNAKLTEELAIIIKGHEGLGVEGIRVRQQKDDQFKEQITARFAELKKEFEKDERVESLRKQVDDLEDWRTTWTKAIDLLTNSKTWRFVFLVGLGATGLVLFIKLKAFDLIHALQNYINTK